MNQTRDQNLKDLKNISDAQERLHVQLRSLWENRKIDTHKVRDQLNELKLLQFILYFLIFSGIFAFFILISINIHLLIIIIDVGVLVVYISSLKYVSHKYRKILKVSKKEFKLLIKNKQKSENSSTFQLILYSFITITTIVILIISMIGIHPLILIIIISVSLLYIYLYRDIEEDDTSKI